MEKKHPIVSYAVLPIGALLFAIITLCACGNGAKSAASADDADSVAEDTTVLVEELPKEDTLAFTTYGNHKGDINGKVLFDWPTSGDESVVNAIRTLINDQLAAHPLFEGAEITPFNGDLSDGQALYDHYQRQYRSQYIADSIKHDGGIQRGHLYFNAIRQWQNDKALAYEFRLSFRAALFGFVDPEEAEFDWGNLIDKSNGNVLETLIDREKNSLTVERLLYKELGDYNLYDEIKGDEAVPLPVCEPYITEYGKICFTYGPCEIAPLPTNHHKAKLSVEDVWEILTPAAKRLLR